MRRALFLGCLASVACGPSFSYTRTNPSPHVLTQRRPDQVEVHTIPPGDRPYVDIGVIDADDPTVDPSGETSPAVVQRLREQAGKIGCDAIVVPAPSHVSAGLASSDRYHATCIVYK